MNRLLRLPVWLMAAAMFVLALAFALRHDAPVVVDIGVLRWEGLPFGPLLLFAFVCGALCGLSASVWIGARLTLERNMLKRRLARQEKRQEVPATGRRVG